MYAAVSHPSFLEGQYNDISPLKYANIKMYIYKKYNKNVCGVGL